MLQGTVSNFQSLTGEGVVLVDFYADWCGPCRALTPVLEQLEGASVIKINVDSEAELARKFNVSSIPTLVLLKDGEVVSQMVGLQKKDFIQQKINEAIGV